MVDMNVKADVALPAHVQEEIRDMQLRVMRAGRAAGAAQACADGLREVTRVLRSGPKLEPEAIAALLDDMAGKLDVVCARTAQHLAAVTEVLAGDVVQVDPRGDELGFGATFAVVERAEGWGVVAYVRVPGPQGGDAYVRLGHGQYQKVGVAEWLHDPLAAVGDRANGRSVPIGTVAAEELAKVPVWRAAMDRDTCAACREADGHAVTPALAPPHPQCTHPDGCRCVIVGLPRG